VHQPIFRPWLPYLLYPTFSN